MNMYQVFKLTRTKQMISHTYSSLNTCSSLHLTLVWCLVICSLLVFLSLIPIQVHADAPKTLQISPAVIDEKAKQRDIMHESITLQNVSDHTLNLFPAVEDVNKSNGDQSFSYADTADARSDSLANWIELSRGVIQLTPGETKTVPFVIHVNMNAVPGLYHAELNFTDGETRDQTTNRAPDGSASVNVEVKADIREGLQLTRFSTDRMVFNGDDVLFNYNIENNGNQDLQPTGDIRIYNRRGEEVATIDVNKEGKSISPEQTAQLASVWSAVNGFGQFKALITVNYGKTQTASVQDTVFFWIVPWKQLLGLFTATMIVMVILGIYFHRWFEERHLNKLAVAGLLKNSPGLTAAAYIPPFPPAPPAPRKPPQRREPEIKKEPKEPIVMRLAENAVLAWRLFTTYKRSGRITPKDIAEEKAAFIPRRIVQKEIVPHSPEMPVESAHHMPLQYDNDGTIDLTSVMHRAPKEQLHEGHVVNLKRTI
jgi:hypothetical protein